MMSSEQLVRYCAPTLAGIKTGSLYTLHGIKVSRLNRDLSYLNRLLKKKGVRIIPLRQSDDDSLIYLYRPGMLQKDLADPRARRLLRSLGYSRGSVEDNVSELASRIRAGGTFPHEIGLFLGYPPTDVLGFINDPHDGFLFTGYWKVYSDEDKARAVFRRYRRCTLEYQRMLMSGRTLEQLVV